MQSWLNHQWYPAAEGELAIVSPLLKPYIGVFTTLRIYQGQPVWPYHHVHRVLTSARELGISTAAVPEQLVDAVGDWPRINQVDHGVLRIYAWSANSNNNILISGEPMEFTAKLTWKLGYARVPRYRNDITVRHKTCNRLLLDWERQQGLRSGWDDVIFCNEIGEITETSRCSLVWFDGEKVFTPHVDCGLLSGIGRAHLLARCEQLGYEVVTGGYYPADLESAETVIAVNSLRGIIRISAIDKYNYYYESPWLLQMEQEWASLIASPEAR